jgi:hypothetical protein
MGYWISFEETGSTDRGSGFSFVWLRVLSGEN